MTQIDADAPKPDLGVTAARASAADSKWTLMTAPPGEPLRRQPDDQARATRR